jgi:hypothetical protein
MTPQLYPYIQGVRRFVAQHHSVLFIVLLCLLIGVAIYGLNDVLTASTADTSETASSTISGFDQSTIDKIKKLHASGDTGDTLVFPAPRSNPFAE